MKTVHSEVSRQDALGTNSAQEESPEDMGVFSRVQGSNSPTSTETQFLKIPTVEGHLSSLAGSRKSLLSAFLSLGYGGPGLGKKPC